MRLKYEVTDEVLCDSEASLIDKPATILLRKTYAGNVTAWNQTMARDATEESIKVHERSARPEHPVDTSDVLEHPVDALDQGQEGGIRKETLY